jgi:hypothetical protein
MLELDAVILPLMIVVGVKMPEILFKCGRFQQIWHFTQKRSGMKHSNSLVYDARGMGRRNCSYLPLSVNVYKMIYGAQMYV